MAKNSLTSLARLLWSIGRSLFWGVLWLAGLAALLLYPIRWLSGDRLDPVRLVSYVLPWLLLLLVPGVVIAGLARRKWLAAALAAPALGIGAAFAPLFLPGRAVPPPAGSFPLKIVSHNLYGRGNAGAIVELMRQEQPDVLLLQELHPDLAALPVADLAGDFLGDLYPELYVDIINEPASRFVQAVLSRYPLTRLSADLDQGRVQKVLVETPAGVIQVWNVHLFAPFRVPPAVHDHYARALVEAIAAVEGPLIAGGDFNAAEPLTTYRLMSSYLRNAHWEAGWGFGFSYPAPPYTVEGVPVVTGPLYRIDHVFYNHYFVAGSARTLPAARGSDHLPVMAELFLVQPLSGPRTAAE